MLRLVSLLSLILATAPVAAQKVYKWVGTDGEITYSTTPPPEVTDKETVTIPGGVSEAERAAAIEQWNQDQFQREEQALARTQTLEKQAGHLEMIAEAQSELDSAKRELDLVRNSKKPNATHIELLEGKVKLARQRLAEVRARR